MKLGFGIVLEKLRVALVELLSNDLNPLLTLHRLQVEPKVCLPLIGLVMGLRFFFILVQSVRSHLYARRERA